ILAVLASGLVLVLAVGAAAAPRDALAATQVAAGTRTAAAGGTWGPAQVVAGALNTGGFAQVNSVSCAAAGNCSAGGYYTSSAGPTPAFVVNETNGTWGSVQVVGAALNIYAAAVNSVSCPSAGHCSAGGSLTDNSGLQAMVANET